MNQCIYYIYTFLYLTTIFFLTKYKCVYQLKVTTFFKYLEFGVYLRLMLPLLYFYVLIGSDHEFVQSSTNKVRVASFYIHVLSFSGIFYTNS